jgi:hypothetical protein
VGSEGEGRGVDVASGVGVVVARVVPGAVGTLRGRDLVEQAARDLLPDRVVGQGGVEGAVELGAEVVGAVAAPVHVDAGEQVDRLVGVVGRVEVVDVEAERTGHEGDHLGGLRPGGVGARVVDAVDEVVDLGEGVVDPDLQGAHGGPGLRAVPHRVVAGGGQREDRVGGLEPRHAEELEAPVDLLLGAEPAEGGGGGLGPGR